MNVPTSSPDEFIDPARLQRGVVDRSLRTRVHHVKASELSSATAQTAGMQRFAAITGGSVGSKKNDYIFVPPYVPHREENPDTDTSAVIVIARSTQEAIVVNLPALYALSNQPK